MAFHPSLFGYVDLPDPVERLPNGLPYGIRTVRRPTRRPAGRV